MKVIVVATYGWVFVGDLDEASGRAANQVKLIGASNIMKWGTQSGLGQLALKGPTQDTRLGAIGVVTIPTTSIIAIMECDESKWVKK
jgi:hypothetical protein